MSAVRAADGRYVVRGNRWDELPDRIPEPPTVSVVIPYFEAQHDLDLVLAGLSVQTHPPTRLQIVVADDGSRRPPRVDPDVVVVRQADRGFRAAAARNLGARAADGDVLCFLDGDTVPEPDYVRNAVRLPASTADGVVVGRRRHADLSGIGPADVVAWFGGRRPAPRELPEPSWLVDAYAASADLLHADDRSYRHVISAVLTCARDIFDAVGGFDATFTAYGGEDWDLAHRMFTAGAVLAHVPAAVAWHAGGDWAGREPDPATARAQKNAETLAVARRIPDPHLRGVGSWDAFPLIAARVPTAAAGSTAARIASIHSLLRAHDDVGVWTDAETAALCSTSRVRAGEVPPDVRARARLRLDVTGPVRFDRGRLAELVAMLAAPGPGRVRTDDGRVTMTSSRAWFRGARHAIPLATLFGTATVAAFPAIGDDIELWHELPCPT